MLKINGKNIDEIKINSSFISQAKINGKIVFDKFSNLLLNLNDKIIKLTGKGECDIYYANNNTIINDYSKICTLNDSDYQSFNSLNVAPYNVNKIVACKSGTNKIVATVDLNDSLKCNVESKLYSVGILSDIHIDNDGTDEAQSQNDLRRALNFFRNEGISFVGIAGDITNSYGDSTDYSAYNSIINEYSDMVIKTCAGNHDVGVDYQSYLNIEKQYVYNYQDDFYVFLSLNAWDNNNPLSSEQITWLTNILKANKNKRVFLFFHFYIDPVGNVNQIYQSSLCISNTAGTTGYQFRQLLKEYKDNLIMFNGHSHLLFELQELGADANIRDKTDDCCILVHVSSCARPRDKNRENVYAGSQGYIMDVYSDYIVLKGIDFVKGKYLPIANYKVNFKANDVVIEDTNLLDLSESNWTWNNNGGEASATYDSTDNSIVITYDASSSFGLNIKQNNLFLKAGKTYRFSCDNVGSGTYIGLDNNGSMMLNSGRTSVDYIPTSDLSITQVTIWCDKNTASYNKTKWNIRLEEV